jgi:ribonuclease HI
MSDTRPFYAVARGHTVGVFRTWAECLAQTARFSRAAFKKFNTLREAETFIANYAAATVPSPKRSIAAVGSRPRETADDDSDDSDDEQAKREKRARLSVVNVFSDGASKGNGRTHAVAGSACCFQRASGVVELRQRTPGRQTNSRAELFAAALALHATLADAAVVLSTDSDYVVRGVAEIDSYRRHGWSIAPGKELANADLWQLLGALMDERAKLQLARVRFKHVLAHSGIEGNERADRLSVEATGLAPATRAELRRLFSSIPAFEWSIVDV